MGMTIIEKILARASGAATVAPGDLAVVDVDLAVLIDLSFSRGSWREGLKVHDPDKVVVVFDHERPALHPAHPRKACARPRVRASFRHPPLPRCRARPGHQPCRRRGECLLPA